MPRRNSGPRLIWSKRREAYYISYTVKGRSRTRSTGTRSREEAEAALADFLQNRAREAAVLAGRRQLYAPHELRIDQTLLWYATERGPDVAAPKAIGAAIDHLASWWGSRVVADVAPATVAEYRRHRETNGTNRHHQPKGAAPATVDRELGVLRSAIRWAWKNGRLTAPVSVGATPRRPARDRWLTSTEAARLLKATRESPPHIRLFVRLALWTGARHSALTDLTWDRVDLAARVIHLQPEGREETAKRRPTVPIPAPLYGWLVRARKAAINPYVLTWRGRPVRSCRRGFTTAAQRAGLDGVTPHVLRHTIGTWMAKEGVSLLHVGRWLGHESTRTTELYAKHAPDHLDTARAALEHRTRARR